MVTRPEQTPERSPLAAMVNALFTSRTQNNTPPPPNTTVHIQKGERVKDFQNTLTNQKGKLQREKKYLYQSAKFAKNIKIG